MRGACLGQSHGARRLRAHSRQAWRSDCVWRACWAHCAADVNAAAWGTGAAARFGGRHAGDSGASGIGMSETKHVHVIGIGGSAMAPLAGMLREHGFRVTGSDSGVYPPASTLLESLGISFFHSFDAANLMPAPDLVVIGNIIARGNSELEEVLDRKISYHSMPEILE